MENKIHYTKIVSNLVSILFILLINLTDLIISITRMKSSKIIRYKILSQLSNLRLLNQNFVSRTFLEEQRVSVRFQIENDLKFFLKNFLSEKSIYWDVGGCVGNFAIYAAHTGSEVIIFEPDGLVLSSLLQNIYESGLTNISCYPIALGNIDSISKLYMRNFQIASAYNSVNNQIGPNGQIFQPQAEQNVCEFRASTLIKKFNFKVPTHIKIDVDGNELEVLLGFGNILMDQTIRAVFIELDFQSFKARECHKLLTNFNFIKQDARTDSIPNNILYIRQDFNSPN